MRNLLIVLLVAALLSASGCMSPVATFSRDTDEWNRIYIGTRMDVRVLMEQSGDRHPLATFFRMVFLLDLPLSIILDTLFLPYTIPFTIVHGLRRLGRRTAAAQ